MVILGYDRRVMVLERAAHKMAISQIVHIRPLVWANVAFVCLYNSVFLLKQNKKDCFLKFIFVHKLSKQ